MKLIFVADFTRFLCSHDVTYPYEYESKEKLLNDFMDAVRKADKNEVIFKFLDVTFFLLVS